MVGHPAGRIDPVRSGHAYVHQYDVGIVAPGQLHRLVAVLRLCDDLDPAGGLEHRLEPGAGKRLVVCDENSNWAHRAYGSVARTR